MSSAGQVINEIEKLDKEIADLTYLRSKLTLELTAAKCTFTFPDGTTSSVTCGDSLRGLRRGNERAILAVIVIRVAYEELPIVKEFIVSCRAAISTFGTVVIEIAKEGNYE